MGFGVSQFRAKVLSMTGQSDAEYSPRHAAYDLKNLRGKQLIAKMGRSRRYDLRPSSMRSIAALEILSDHVVRPVLAGMREPRSKPQPSLFPALDRYYERLRLGIQPVFQELGIAA
jgi:hypothetical protein